MSMLNCCVRVHRITREMIRDGVRLIAPKARLKISSLQGQYSINSYHLPVTRMLEIHGPDMKIEQLFL